MSTEKSADSFQKLEDTANQAVDALKATYEQGRVTAEDKIREYPLAAVGVAAAVGFIFRFGVIRTLLGVTLRTAGFAVKPLLIVAAVMKVVDLMKEVSPPSSLSSTAPRKKAVKSSSPLDLIDAPEVENPVLH